MKQTAGHVLFMNEDKGQDLVYLGGQKNHTGSFTQEADTSVSQKEGHRSLAIKLHKDFGVRQILQDMRVSSQSSLGSKCMLSFYFIRNHLFPKRLLAIS